MKYRVTFMERTDKRGNPTESPSSYADIDFAEGIVAEKTFVERTAPSAMHNEDSLEEDDSFLSIGSETWDYEIDGTRQQDFLAGLENSQMVMECVLLDEQDSR